MNRYTLKLNELMDAILSQMDKSGFKKSTRGSYITLFNRLFRMAKERGDEYYTAELGQAFIDDQSHMKNKKDTSKSSTVFWKMAKKYVNHVLPDI